jgi:hypothetical protein
MKKIVLAAGLLGIISSSFGCAYAGLATSGDKVVVLRNGMFTNSAFVCKVAENGVSACAEGESP